VIVKEISLDFLMDLHVLSCPEYEKVIFDVPYVYTFIWTCTLLAPDWLDELYSYSVFKSLSLTSQYPVIMSITVPEIEALQMNPK
jgi:hypothetical protein